MHYKLFNELNFYCSYNLNFNFTSMCHTLFLAISFTVLLILPTTYSLPSTCNGLQAILLSAQLSSQIIETGNNPQCYSAITTVYSQLCGLLTSINNYSSNTSDPTVLISAFKNLIQQGPVLNDECGISLGVYALRETTFQQKYCIENINKMVPLATSALESTSNLDISIPALNNLYYHMSYALNTCGGMTKEFYNSSDNESVVDESQPASEAFNIRTFLADIYTQ